MMALMVLISGLLAVLLVIAKVVDALGIPLFLVFLILRFCNVIAWGWIFICLPLIIWVGAILLTVLFTAILAWIDECD